MMPSSGKAEEANGVAYTMAVAAAVMSKGARKAIHHTRRASQGTPRAFQPALK